MVFITNMFEVPLSSNATALLRGAPTTVVVGVIVLSPIMMASKRTFHRLGDMTGHVGIAVLFSIAEYRESYSPAN
jgi:hypothetical protein